MNTPPASPHSEAPVPEPVRRPVLLGAAFIGVVAGFIGIFVGLSIGGLREVRNTAALRSDPLGAAFIHPALDTNEAPV